VIGLGRFKVSRFGPSRGPRKPLAEVVPHREWQAPSDRKRFTGVKSIEWRGRAMKLQPSAVRNSFFIFAVMLALAEFARRGKRSRRARRLRKVRRKRNNPRRNRD